MANTRFVTDGLTDGRADGAILICSPGLLMFIHKYEIHKGALRNFLSTI